MSKCGSCDLYEQTQLGVYCEGNTGDEECAHKLQEYIAALKASYQIADCEKDSCIGCSVKQFYCLAYHKKLCRKFEELALQNAIRGDELHEQFTRVTTALEHVKGLCYLEYCGQCDLDGKLCDGCITEHCKPNGGVADGQ